ncbi:universal stress protein family protein [Rhizobium mongolense USDA 1844]|uniref:Universal stress protein family protein n=2 Tax=Rhizobium mongolense TaxID=57676 RepID=A0A559TKY5_9HYPH|nr:universal stress protein family protein [Rhizobium mongolense USDA 1844]
MTFRTVLSVMRADDSDQDVRTAATLCDEIGAALSVLIIGFAARPPISAGIDELYAPGHEGRAWKIGMLDRRCREIDGLTTDMVRLEKRVREIETLLGAMHLRCEVNTHYGDQDSVGDAVRQRALYADLTIIGPLLLGDRDLALSVIDGSLAETGKPLLVVPKGAKATLCPRHVLVGWDWRVEAFRAVREATRLLSRSKEVRVVMSDRGAACNGNRDPGAEIADYLARHGVRVTVDRMPSVGPSLDAVLARHAADASADMIVMGAHGYRGLRQRIFGGATRWIPEKLPLPLFLAR